MTLTRPQAEAIAVAITRIRPDWDHPGVIAALGRASNLGTPAAILRALADLADNPKLRTPMLLPETGNHWRRWDGEVARKASHAVPCPDHPDQSHPCPECADRHTPMPDDVRAEIAHAVEEAKRALPVDTRTPLDPTKPTWTAPPRTARP